jgi:uncharacterized protein with von Willebrand factor type A (vWA) domain
MAAPVSVALYSARERLRNKDFAHYSQAELKDADTIFRNFNWRPPDRISRRRRPSRHGSSIDLRRLLRRTLGRSGEIVELPRRQSQAKPRSLLLLCDVSGSMDAYTRALLHFLHAFSGRFSRVEVFVFGTRLTRITHLLQCRDVDVAVDAVSAEVEDWSGGTRLGEALGCFHRTWARRVAANGAVVLLISDGWDRGDPAKLAVEMARLQRLSHRLIWLNPLMGSRAYEPLTRGMKAALPYVDDFLPVHNLASVEALACSLSRIGPVRPARRATRPVT